MNTGNAKLKLHKSDDEYVYPFKCSDYILNILLILKYLIVYAMF